MKHFSSLHRSIVSAYVAGMVTHGHKPYRGRLFLKEHRKAKGVSAEAMGKQLGIERESVYRLERNPGTLTHDKQCIYAAALNIEPEELWWPPGTPSLDAMISHADRDVQAMAADIVRRLISGGKA